MKISDKLKTVKLKDIHPYINNAKKHDANQIKRLVKSLDKFGYYQHIGIDSKNTIVVGHGRWLAMQEKLSPEDKIEVVDFSYLKPKQIKELRIYDNKVISQKYDENLLAIDIQSMLNSDASNYEIVAENLAMDSSEIMAFIPDDKKTTNNEDVIPEKVKSITKIGDLWELGDHRLLCGDSTKDRDLLINGNIDMVFTDPPYNIDYQGVKDKREKIKNDKMADEDFVIFLVKSLYSVQTMYVCCSWQYSHLFKKAMEDINRKPKAMIIWAQHLDKYFKRHEIIYYHGPFGGEKTIRGVIWQLKRERNTVHPTMKPIELIEIALSDNPSCLSIYDPFLGSGSTLIACEKTNRKCYGMELDEHYCDVIVKRYYDYCKANNKKPIIKLNGKKYPISEI